MKFSNIRLLVTDFDSCYTFYHETLGLECSWGKPGENYASFNTGIPSGLAIFRAELMNDANIGITGAAEAVAIDKAVVVFEVPDVDQLFDRLENKGINSLTTPKDMAAWGIRVIHFRDPENNLIEVFSPLAG
jgi:catechol 2,3-dioxygenase-like lactoylglutathione lyase family enzyme